MAHKSGGRVAPYFCREILLKNNEIRNHGINKTVSNCIIVHKFVKRMLTKMNEQKFVYLSTIIFYFLVHYAYKSKDCI